MITCHSEYGVLKRVFLKTPQSAWQNQDKITTQWQALNFLGCPNLVDAIAEYKAFQDAVNKTSPQCYFFPVEDVSIDSLYCRDASIATDGGMILCNMGKANRVGEPEAARSYFLQCGIHVLGAITAPGRLEGGDVTWLDPTTLAVGRTYRTNDAGIRQLRHLVKPLGVDVLEVHLPHYKGPGDVFHLMSIISPVDRDLAVVYSPLIPVSFRDQLIDRGFRFIEVPDAEFETMGCNVLAVGPRLCVMAAGNPNTARFLRDAGCQVTEYEGNSISVMGGGGPTCLTRPLEREI